MWRWGSFIEVAIERFISGFALGSDNSSHVAVSGLIEVTQLMTRHQVIARIRVLTQWVRNACGGRYVHPPHAGNNYGFATAELAVNLISLTGVFVFLIAGISWGHAQFVVTDAARSAARMIARGEPSTAIESAIAHRYPRVQIIFEQNDDLVTAKAFIAPWAPAFVSLEHVPTISASATADVEGWGAPPWR